MDLKFLADVNIESEIIEFLKIANIDIKWVGDINPGLEDIDIFNLSNYENRILITSDKDFGEIVFRQKLISVGVILLRFRSISFEERANKILLLINNNKNKLKNNFIVVSEKKIRIINYDY